MRLKRQVVMLPTNEKAKFGDLVLYEENSRLFINDTSDAVFPKKTKHINLYILSDEKIEDGDWAIEFYLDWTPKEVFQCKGIIPGECLVKKIIATTDSSIACVKDTLSIPQRRGLINHYPTEKWILPQPSNAFIQKWVSEYNKGNVITEVMVEYFLTEDGRDEWKHLKVDKDGCITTYKLKDSWNREEVEAIFREGVSLGQQIARNPDYYSLHDPIKDWKNKNL